MSFPRYPAYQETQVPWARRLPMHWVIESARRLFSQERNPSLPADEQLSATQKYGVVPQHLFMDLEDQKVALALSGVNGFKHVTAGDFVISLRSFQGGIEYSPYSGCVSPAYTVLRPSQAVDCGYFRYLLKSQEFVATLQSMTDGLRDGKAVSYQQFGQLRLPVPPLNEQAAIASFLDRETAKIDALIAEQERLIDRLQEKRQSVISRAVTKGLNPDVPMKRSGVEWMGDVPAHWTQGRLKRFIRSMDYGISDALEPEGAVAVLRMGNIQDGGVKFDDLKFAGSVGDDLLLMPGDLLYNRTNSLDLIGKVGIFESQLSQPVSFASYLVRLRLVSQAWPHYFAYLLNTEGILGLARASAFVAIGQCNLNPSRYAHTRVVVPPHEEQVTIVEYLKVALREIDQLAGRGRDAIQLLRERRSALISAAVTGQIDVRELVEQKAA